VTRATITNKTTGVKLEGEYNHVETDTLYSFAFNIDGTSVTNTMAVADWDVDEQKTPKYADAIDYIERIKGDTARAWQEQVRTRQFSRGLPMDQASLQYTIGWVGAYNSIIALLRNAS